MFEIYIFKNENCKYNLRNFVVNILDHAETYFPTVSMVFQYDSGNKIISENSRFL